MNLYTAYHHAVAPCVNDITVLKQYPEVYLCTDGNLMCKLTMVSVVPESDVEMPANVEPKHMVIFISDDKQFEIPEYIQKLIAKQQEINNG